MIDPEVKKYVDDSYDDVTRFSTKKVGDTPTDAQQLTPKGYVDGQIASVYASVSGTIPSSVASYLFDYFSNGSDGDVTFDGTTSYSFASITVASSTYSLLRDLRASTLTVSSSITLKPSGNRIYARNMTIIGDGEVNAKGNNAISVFGAVALPLTGTYLSSIIAAPDGSGGGAGGSGSNGTDGQPGKSVFGVQAHSLGGIGCVLSGAKGGDGGPAGGHTGGIGGTSVLSQPTSVANYDSRLPLNSISLLDFDSATLAYFKYTTSPVSSSGGGGGGGASPEPGNLGGAGGTGGGGGGTGGIIAIYAEKLTINPGGRITARGGNGGDGNPGGNGSVVTQISQGGGGGGGGGGGSGGIIYLVYKTLVNNGASVAGGGLDVSGGLGGNGGTQGKDGNGNAGTGIAGSSGRQGISGASILIAVN